jgi:hypothetical protein
MGANDSTVSVTVLIIAIILTALVTTAIFTCITCLTLRSRTRRREYQHEQATTIESSPPPLNTPHIIDLHKSFSAANSPKPMATTGQMSPPPPPLELGNVMRNNNNNYYYHSSNSVGGGGHSRTPSILSPRLEPSASFVGLGVHVRGDSVGGSSERLLASPIPQAKLS